MTKLFTVFQTVSIVVIRKNTVFVISKVISDKAAQDTSA